MMIVCELKTDGSPGRLVVSTCRGIGQVLPSQFKIRDRVDPRLGRWRDAIIGGRCRNVAFLVDFRHIIGFEPGLRLDPYIYVVLHRC